jgi:Flp pilus assembly protein TadD
LEEPSDDWRSPGELDDPQEALAEGLEQPAAELEIPRPGGGAELASEGLDEIWAKPLASEPSAGETLETAGAEMAPSFEGAQNRDAAARDEQAGESDLDDDDRETMELTPWDSTLSTLRDDPDVSEALDAIDSGPAVAPFLRSIPPARRDGTAASPASGPRSADVEVDEIRAEPQPGQGREPSRRPLLLAAFLLLGGAIVFSLLLRPTEPASDSELQLEKERAADDERPAPAELTFEPERVLVQTKDAEPVEDETDSTTSTDEVLTQETPSEQLSRASGNERQTSYEAQLALARKHKQGTLAVSAYRRALELKPEGAEALAELGFLMLQRGRNAEAAELARKATLADPSSSLAWITLGSARQYLNDEDGAMSAYRNCVKHGRGPYVAECRAVLR